MLKNSAELHEAAAKANKSVPELVAEIGKEALELQRRFSVPKDELKAKGDGEESRHSFSVDRSPTLVYSDAYGEPTAKPENQSGPGPEGRLVGALRVLGNDRGRDGKAASAELEAYASEAGLVLDAGTFERTVLSGRKELESGSEHRVFVDKATHRVIKLTHPDLVGDGSVGQSADVVGYLMGLHLQRELFDTDIRLEGIVRLDGELPQIVTSQPFYSGRPATKAEISAHMSTLGFKFENGSWRKDGVTVADVVSANVMAVKGKNGRTAIIPFDVQITSEKQARFSNDEVRGKATSGQVAALHGALDGMRANGVDVQFVQGLAEHGQWSPGHVIMTVTDLINPTESTLIRVIHEAGHEVVFSRLGIPESMRESYNRALSKLGVPEGAEASIQASVDAATGSQKTPVRSEEILVERAARKLVAEGFDPSAAKGLAHAFVRVVKDLYYRAAMAIQRGILGEDHVSPKLAEAYFENRLKSFLTGKPSMSFLSFVGGPKLSMEQHVDTFPLDGGNSLAAEFNYATGRMEYALPSGDTMEGLKLALRLSVDRKGRHYIDKKFIDVARDVTAETPPIPAARGYNDAADSLTQQINMSPRVSGVSLLSPDHVAMNQSGATNPIYGRIVHALTRSDRKTQDPVKIALAPLITNTIKNFDLKTTGQLAGSNAVGTLFFKLYRIGGKEMWHVIEANASGDFVTHEGFTNPDRSLSPTEFAKALENSGISARMLKAVVQKEGARPPKKSAPTTELGPEIPNGPLRDALASGVNGQVPSRFPDTLKLALDHATSKGTSEVKTISDAIDAVYQANLDRVISDQRATETIDYLESITTDGGSQIRHSFSETGPAMTGVRDEANVSRDTDSAHEAQRSVAAYNALGDMHAELHDAFHRANPGTKIELGQFLRQFAGSDGPVADKIAFLHEKLKAAGLTPGDETVRPHDLLSDAQQKQAADTAYGYAQRLHAYLSSRAKMAEQEIIYGSRKLADLGNTLMGMMKDRTNADLYLQSITKSIPSLLRGLDAQVKGIGTRLNRLGIMAQTIEKLEGRKIDPAIAKHYETTINEIYRELSDPKAGQKFTDMMEKLAQLKMIDWKKTTIPEIKKQVLIHAKGDELLADLLDNSPKGKARLAIAVAFAKSELHIMEMLALRTEKDMVSMEVVNKALGKAIEGTAESVKEARKIMLGVSAKLPRAIRLIDAFDKRTAEHRRLHDELQRNRAFVKFYNEGAPVLREQMLILERALGQTTQSWEGNHGDTYPRAGAVTDSEAQVMANAGVWQLKGDGTVADSIREDIKRNEEWLDAQPEANRGANWQGMKATTEKMKSMVGLLDHETYCKQSGVNLIFGSLVDKFESTKIPALRVAAKQMREYLAERDAAMKMTDPKGIAWLAAMDKAMRAVGLKKWFRGTSREVFETLFYQSVHSFAEKNSDHWLAYKDQRQAFEAFLPKIERFLMADRETAKYMAMPGAWEALKKWYRQDYDNHETVMNYHRKWGLKIREPQLVKDAYGNTKTIYIERDPIGVTWGTSTRRAGRKTIRMYQEMRELGWLGTTANSLDADAVAQDFHNDPAALDARLSRLMPATVQSAFFDALATGMHGDSAFFAPRLADDMSVMASRENARKAYEASGGSMVKFAVELHRLESAAHGTSESLPEFVGRTVHSMQEYFLSLHEQFQEWDNSKRQGQPTPPRVLSDARVSESWPGAWLEYQPLGHMEMRQVVDRMAAQKAFGRDMQGMHKNMQHGVSELSKREDELNRIRSEVELQNPMMSESKREELARKEVERPGSMASKNGWSYGSMKDAARNRQSAEFETNQFSNLMRQQAGLSLELRPYVELTGALAGATVQGPGTAIMQLADFAQFFTKFGLSRTAVRGLMSAAGNTLSTEMGTLFQVFHGQIKWNAEANARLTRLGIVDPDAYTRFKDAVAASQMDLSSAHSLSGKAIVKLARAIRVLTSAGIGSAKEGATNAYPTLKPFGFFTQQAMAMHAGFVNGFFRNFGDAVERAIEHFKANPSDAANPKFRFTDKQLGYSKGWLGIGDETRAFAFINEKLAQYGVGSLEQLARDAIKRRVTDSKASVFNDSQWRSLASLVQNEVTLENNPASGPSAAFTNPILNMGNKLVGWSVRKSNDLWENGRKANMSAESETAWKAFMIGMRPYLAIVPASIAVAMLKDEYETHVLKKKANRMDPTTSFKGVVDALGRVGQFGIFGDAANSWYNRDTEKPFDVDNRVFFLSSMHAAGKALYSWYQQDGADYQTVGRPLIAALGGSGYLQYAQVLNTMTSQFGGGPMFEQEARVTARINALNYLRTAGRELKMDVRVARGGEVITNPIKPYVGQMLLAAYANDAAAFRDARMQAIQAARDEKKDDPADYVKRAFASFDPLKSVFRTQVSETEYRKILMSLPGDGRTAVESAVRLWNGYASQLGIKPDFGKKESLIPKLALPKLGLPDLGAARAYAAGY